MVITCNIEWENNAEGVYFSGQVLAGRITLTSDKIKKVKAILLKIQGIEATCWTETRNHVLTNKATANSLTYKGQQHYIDSNTYLLGHSDKDEDLHVEPGIHSFSFASHIPTNCPSSFEGQYGHVRYTIKVILQRSSKYNITFSKAVTILKIMDLNYASPLLKMPFNTELEQRYCFGPCRYLPFRIDLFLPLSGFVPGQHIPVHVLTNTNTFLAVGALYIRLIMSTNYMSQDPNIHQYQEAIVVSELKDDATARSGNEFHYILPVPATPPTCNSLSGLLQISYYVELEAKIKMLTAHQIVRAPVTIGNVPLLSVTQQQPRLLINNANGQILPWLTNDSISQPQFEEAPHVLKVNINEGDEYDCGEKRFTPKYTVFR